MVENYQTPLTLFRSGMGTDEISAHLGCSEALAYNLYSRAKEKERLDIESVMRQREHNKAYYHRQKAIRHAIKDGK